MRPRLPSFALTVTNDPDGALADTNVCAALLSDFPAATETCLGKRRRFMQDHAERLYYALKRSWSGETSGLWSRENPARGQGSVTALVVQDIFGGEIAKTAVSGAQHFYNIIDGVRWDFTFTQFDLPVGYQDHPANRTEVMATITPLQYAYLSACIRKALGHG
ncbi:hypothetical protein C241_23805 [Bradyrhizobium lupini HPC(L)]|nr:hypothetical protein C241_23805 [Bradyrhizobium lupini HPC(L)]